MAFQTTELMIVDEFGEKSDSANDQSYRQTQERDDYVFHGEHHVWIFPTMKI